MQRLFAFAGSALLLAFVLPAGSCAVSADEDLLRESKQALRQACDFFHDQVSHEGGYLWRYSADLQKREGEKRADATTVWVQPPGTPSIGRAVLDVHRLTGDAHYLEVARDAGRCLVNGQLRSGGWDPRIEFDPAQRQLYDYRVDAHDPEANNTTTLDDDTTQSALRFLMLLDEVLQFQDEQIHEAVRFGLDALLAAQYPNGAWPQRFSAAPIAADFPVLPASYPETWPRKKPKDKKYTGYYTFNDNVLARVIDLMLIAEQTYGDARYRQAAVRGGDFMLLAQMPDPQPGWAQQYDRQMHPVWARRFEPPALTGSESKGIVRKLLRMYRETGQRKYLDAAGRALAYYRSVRLPEDKLARFYELQTDKPLYFTHDYQLTYDDSDLPTHYAFKVRDWTASVTRDYEALAAKPHEPMRPMRPPAVPKLTDSLATKARAAIETLDDRGAWVESGRLKYQGDDGQTRQVIESQTFTTRIRDLARYIAAAQAAAAAAATSGR